MKRILASPLLLICLAIPAWADDKGEEKEYELSPVIVGGEKNSPVVDVTGDVPAYSRFALPESAKATEQVFTQKDIEAMRPRDVYDLIETSLGMVITRQGARVHNFTKSRGDNTSIILDGVYMSTTEAQRVLGDLPVAMIESVKLIRDSTVLTMGPLTGFGSAGSGSPNQGFIVITTRRGKTRETELRGSYASYDTISAGIFHGDSLLNGKLTFGLGYTRTQSSGKSDWNNSYHGDSFLVNGGYTDTRLESGISLFVNKASRNIQRHIGTYTGTSKYPVSGPTPNGVLDKNIWRYDPIDTLAFSYNAALKWSANQTTFLTYGFTEAMGTQFADTTLKAAKASQSADRTHEINLSHTITSEKNTFKAGAQTIFWYQLSEGKSSARKEESYGGYVYDEYRLSDRLSFDGAFRVDAKRIAKGGDKYQDDGGKVVLSDNKWTDQAYAVSLGTSYKLTPVYTLLARFSYNNTPTPDTLTSKNNAELDAEERFKYEAGVAAGFHRAFNLSITGFYYDIKNSKVSAGAISVANPSNPSTPDSVTIYKTANVQRKGVEAAVNGTLMDNATFGVFMYELGYTWFNDSNLNNDTNSPKNRISARFDYRKADYDASLTILRVDPYASYGVIVGDFTTVNASLGKSFKFHGMLAKVSVFGQNLTDEHYATNNKGNPANASWGALRDVGATYGVELSATF